jgi:hypothetical protein
MGHVLAYYILISHHEGEISKKKVKNTWVKIYGVI